MSKENYNALQIVPNFSFGIGEWNSFDAADNTTPEEDLINYLNGEVNVGNDNEAIHFRTLDYQPLKHFQPFCTENQHHHASKQQCSPPPQNIESLNHYNVASKDQQRKMSNILNNVPAVNNDDATDIASNDDWVGSLFHGATIKDNVININITQQMQQQPHKRRYIIYDSDEE